MLETISEQWVALFFPAVLPVLSQTRPGTISSFPLFPSVHKAYSRLGRVIGARDLDLLGDAGFWSPVGQIDRFVRAGGNSQPAGGVRLNEKRR